MAVILKILELAGALGLFLFGMKVMGDGLQSLAGSRLQKMLGYMTNNRFLGFLTGIVFTSIIQSSSATTVFVVSFVNANLLNLTQAIGVILGANIGTTATAWIVSFFGFKFNIADLAIPAIALGLPLMFMKAGKRRSMADVFIGFGLLFLGLMYLKNAVPDVKAYPDILKAISDLSHYGFASTILFVLIGTVFTIIVQSSSAAMAITLTMANAGWIEFPVAAALVLGENIGTTITAQLASLGQSRNSRRAAMAHTLFNVLGVLWMLSIMPLFLRLVESFMPGNFADPEAMPLHLSLFHTLFNLTNAFLFIWFIPAYAKLIERIIPVTELEKDHRTYKLPYLSSALQDTPEMHYLTVKAEIEKMASKVQEMFSLFSQTEQGKNEAAEKALGDRIFAMEDYLDQMQVEISHYISRCMQDRPSEYSAQNLGSFLKIVDDLESLADSVARLMAMRLRAVERKINPIKGFQEGMEILVQEVSTGLGYIAKAAEGPLSDGTFAQVAALEDRVDNQKAGLKKAARKRIQTGNDVKTEILFIDIIEELERMGDLILEVAKESRSLKA